jgi:hypothetical protein
MRLLRTLAPYCYADLAPVQPVSDRLRWEPFQGLTFQVHHRSGPLGLAADRLTTQEHDWMMRVQHGPVTEAVSREALEPVWDVTGGGIPWPTTVPAAEAARLDREVIDVVAKRVPTERIGLLLVLALRQWRDDDRLDTLIDPLPELLRGLVEAGRVGEAGRLIAPLLQWARAQSADRRESALGKQLRGLTVLLLGDDVLRSLGEAADRTLEATELVVFWEALLPDELPALLNFTAAMSDGPTRNELVGLLAKAVEEDPSPLQPAIQTGGLNQARTAIDALAELRPTRSNVLLVLDALDRSEPALQARALEYLLPMRSRRIAKRILPHVTSETRKVRAAALAYMARYAYRPAFDTLCDFTQNGMFANLDLASRCEICKTLGVVDAHEAERLAWTHLPGPFERLPPGRCIPWVVCLAATGAAGAEEYLEAMATSSEPQLRAVATNARSLWERRRASRGQLSPPMTTSPGMHFPSTPGSGVFERPRAGSHRAPRAATGPAHPVPTPPEDEP